MLEVVFVFVVVFVLCFGFLILFLFFCFLFWFFVLVFVLVLCSLSTPFLLPFYSISTPFLLPFYSFSTPWLGGCLEPLGEVKISVLPSNAHEPIVPVMALEGPSFSPLKAPPRAGSLSRRMTGIPVILLDKDPARGGAFSGENDGPSRAITGTIGS